MSKLDNSTIKWLYCGIIGLSICNIIQSNQIRAIKRRITALEQKHIVHKPAGMPKVSQRCLNGRTEHTTAHPTAHLTVSLGHGSYVGWALAHL